MTLLNTISSRTCLLAALVSNEFILIVMIEPVVSQLHRIDNQEKDKMQYFTWTPFLHEEYPLFAISCGHSVKVYRVNSVKEDMSCKIVFYQYFHSSKEILFLEFINENLLFYIDPRNVVTILAVNTFKEADTYSPSKNTVEKFIKREEENTECVVYREMLTSDVVFHMHVTTSSHNLIRSCYANSIVVLHHTLYLLGSLFFTSSILILHISC